MFQIRNGHRRLGRLRPVILILLNRTLRVRYKNQSKEKRSKRYENMPITSSAAYDVDNYQFFKKTPRVRFSAGKRRFPGFSRFILTQESRNTIFTFLQ